MTFHCGCCGELFPTIHRHFHHKIPQAAGGPDTPENIIQLCPGCHDGLHALAHKMLSRKFSNPRVMDTLKILFKENQKAIQMCYFLATRVRDSLIIAREEGIDPDQEVAVSTALPKAVKDLLTVRVREAGFTQEGYLRHLILSDLTHKFGAHPILTEYLKTNSVKSLFHRKRR
jgi:hypothetical protein